MDIAYLKKYLFKLSLMELIVFVLAALTWLFSNTPFYLCLFIIGFIFIGLGRRGGHKQHFYSGFFQFVNHQRLIRVFSGNSVRIVNNYRFPEFIFGIQPHLVQVRPGEYGSGPTLVPVFFDNRMPVFGGIIFKSLFNSGKN